MKDNSADRPNRPGQVIFTDHPEKFMAPVIPLKKYDKAELSSQLQMDLLAVIDSDRYEDLPISQVIGMIEFLKWNIINRCK